MISTIWNQWLLTYITESESCLTVVQSYKKSFDELELHLTDDQYCRNNEFIF